MPNGLGGLGGFGARASIGRSSVTSAAGRDSMRSVIEEKPEQPPKVVREAPPLGKKAKRASFAEEV